MGSVRPTADSCRLQTIRALLSAHHRPIIGVPRTSKMICPLYLWAGCTVHHPHIVTCDLTRQTSAIPHAWVGRLDVKGHRFVMAHSLNLSQISLVSPAEGRELSPCNSQAGMIPKSPRGSGLREYVARFNNMLQKRRRPTHCQGLLPKRQLTFISQPTSAMMPAENQFAFCSGLTRVMSRYPSGNQTEVVPSQQKAPPNAEIQIRPRVSNPDFVLLYCRQCAVCLDFLGGFHPHAETRSRPVTQDLSIPVGSLLGSHRGEAFVFRIPPSSASIKSPDYIGTRGVAVLVYSSSPPPNNAAARSQRATMVDKQASLIGSAANQLPIHFVMETPGTYAQSPHSGHGWHTKQHEISEILCCLVCGALIAEHPLRSEVPS
ncbi:hypothetical protein ACRALDRAFT_209804 [Sodiomyces alcalophilus JCM 7366]|uniref:uncharacterized protein n=1 Tax=Sodiomyces alcalophilus JCM 7366 TaxID=591952 RepID=UPI0039B5F83B